MRYIDTGQRDPAKAVGSWLQQHVVNDQTVVAIRWQTGFFGADSLGYFVPALTRLRASNGLVNLLIGSNEGQTQRADVEALLRVAGPPRPNQRIGIVSFENGFFHPKTVHILRADHSAAAYVGSANLTGSGVASVHIEAGVLLDTRDGDNGGVLAQVADAIDWWFAAPRPGLSVVQQPADLDALVASGVINVPPPPPPPRPPRAEGGPRTARGARLNALLQLPGLPPGVLTRPPAAPRSPAVPAGPARPAAAAAPVPVPVAPVALVTPAQWAKQLSRSDAQRKATGNQRGSITLVQAGHAIDAQTYFRRVFFQSANWVSDQTRTGEMRETALVPFDVNLLGRSLGILHIPVTYASNREAAQANYTSLLHLGPLATHFTRLDMTGKWIVLDRRADGSFALAIRDQVP